jgi:pimeloyl-ACP methyl ester carboxylesterase
MIPVFLAAGHRVLAPDTPGFGKSDKPIDVGQHGLGWHRRVLLEFVEAPNLQRVNLVAQDRGGLLGLTLPLAAPARYRGLLVMNTWLATAQGPLPDGFLQWRSMCRSKPDFAISRLFWRGNPQMSEAECAAYDAPFPAQAYRAATQAFPEIGARAPERRRRGGTAAGGRVPGAPVDRPIDAGRGSASACMSTPARRPSALTTSARSASSPDTAPRRPPPRPAPGPPGSAGR